MKSIISRTEYKVRHLVETRGNEVLIGKMTYTMIYMCESVLLSWCLMVRGQIQIRWFLMPECQLNSHNKEVTKGYTQPHTQLYTNPCTLLLWLYTTLSWPLCYMPSCVKFGMRNNTFHCIGWFLDLFFEIIISYKLIFNV